MSAQDPLLPKVHPVAVEILESLARTPGTVYVEGGVGSGRRALVQALRALSPKVRTVEFLQLTEADATSTAYWECAAWLPPADRPTLGDGGDVTLHAAALKVFRALHETGILPVLRVPGDWDPNSHVVHDERGGGRRAKRLLDAVVQSGCSAVVVADAALSASALGISRAHYLPRHEVALEASETVSWGSYDEAFGRLRAAIPSGQLASPFAWRLAVGALALGASADDVRSALRARPALPPLVSLLATRIQACGLEAPVRWLLAIRRPVSVQEVGCSAGISEAHLPLLTACIGYGEGPLRVATEIRTLLRRALLNGAEATTAQHDTLAAYYAGLDGATDPTALDSDTLQAWCEKVHHAAHGGEESAALWARQSLPSPEMYWDRARWLSVHAQKYQAAAEVYRACVARFPRDDYGWHYLAYNLEKAKGPRAKVEHAYREAIALAPENPWWNRRLITFLIEDAQPRTAAQAWHEAIERVDADGALLRESPWLAESFHVWVADAWERAGWLHRARAVMQSIPADILRHADPKVSRRARRMARGGESQRWADFLRNLEEKTGASPELAAQARRLWSVLRDRWGPELPEPMADLTADGERFQFAWSYAHLYVEVETDAQGEVQWFARNPAGGPPEGSEAPCASLPPALDRWLRQIVDA